MRSSAVHEELVKTGEIISLVTVKRSLSEMVEAGILATSGSGKFSVQCEYYRQDFLWSRRS